MTRPNKESKIKISMWLLSASVDKNLIASSLNIRFVFNFAVTHLLLWHRNHPEVCVLTCNLFFVLNCSTSPPPELNIWPQTCEPAEVNLVSLISLIKQDPDGNIKEDERRGENQRSIIMRQEISQHVSKK